MQLEKMVSPSPRAARSPIEEKDASDLIKNSKTRTADKHTTRESMTQRRRRSGRGKISGPAAAGKIVSVIPVSVERC